MAEAGEELLIFDKIFTPDQHYAMVRLLAKLKDENANLDWNSIAYNSISPFEEIPLQKMAFLNNEGAVRAFIEKEDNDTILKEYSKVNQRGCNVLMTAAEFSSEDVLSTLLQHLSRISVDNYVRKVR